MTRATFAAGCFWGVESAFRKIKGVQTAICGYTGGRTKDPTYKEVCGGGTGHAEAVEVEFAPEVVSYVQLVDAFFHMHDPTTLNRQGPDIGAQYRSAIFVHDAEQDAAARSVKERLEKNGEFRRPIVTEISPAPEFYKAEEYHQRYHEKHGVEHC